MESSISSGSSNSYVWKFMLAEDSTHQCTQNGLAKVMDLVPDQSALAIGSRQGRTFMVDHTYIIPQSAPGKARTRRGQQLHKLLGCCGQEIGQHKIQMLLMYVYRNEFKRCLCIG